MVRARLIRLLLVASFAVGYAASPVPVAAAAYGACVTSGIENFFSGVNKSITNNNVRNVNTSIDVSSPSDQFRPCTWSLGNDGASGWLAIIPGAGNPHNGDHEAILQIGIIACNEFWLAACQGNQIRYFWAEGGCGLAIPDPQDLGLANSNSHNYEIRHLDGDVYRMRIDGVTKVSFVASTHDDIKCWIPFNYTMGQWAFERWDRGDGIGDSSHKSSNYQAHHMVGDPGTSGTWVSSPNFGGCFAGPSDSPGKGFCEFGTNYVHGWSSY
jgi:hypothetical protein